MGRILWLLIAGAYAVLVLRAAASPGPWPAVLSGAVYATIAIVGCAWVQSRGLGWRVAYVLVQLVLSFVVFDAANASTGATLLLIVLVVQGVLLLPVPGAIALTVAVPFVHSGMAWAAGLREGLGTLTAVIFAAVITWLWQREQRTRQKLAAANEQLARFAAQAEELATTQERNRVARDIHDGLGHYLTVLQMQSGEHGHGSGRERVGLQSGHIRGRDEQPPAAELHQGGGDHVRMPDRDSLAGAQCTQAEREPPQRADGGCVPLRAGGEQQGDQRARMARGLQGSRVNAGASAGRPRRAAHGRRPCHGFAH
jgi:hypothetical protein